MNIRDLMASPVVTVSAKATVTDAVLLLLERDVTELPVVDDAGDLIGIVGEADLFRERLGTEPTPLEHLQPVDPERGRTVGDIMRRPVLTVQARDSLALCQRLLTRRARSLPVLNGTQVVGLITRRAVLAALVRPDATVQRDVAEKLAANVDRAGVWSVSVRDGVVTLSGTGSEDQTHRASRLAREVNGVLEVHMRSAHAQLVGM